MQALTEKSKIESRRKSIVFASQEYQVQGSKPIWRRRDIAKLFAVNSQNSRGERLLTASHSILHRNYLA